MGRTVTLILVAVVVVVALIVVSQMGFYTIQPIGAIPQGVTLLVWRASSEPFFNSPDAMCLKIQGSVSLLCRGVTLSKASTDRIILRLPYMDWAYLNSTGGKKFDR